MTVLAVWGEVSAPPKGGGSMNVIDPRKLTGWHH